LRSWQQGSGTKVVALVLLAILVVVLLRRGYLTETDLIFFLVLIPSVIVHEVSHGVAALAFGDDTAKRSGRLTLNPLAHVDPFGTIILPAVMLLFAGVAIGYAKPVPVNVSQLRSPRNQAVLVALAGPATNIVLALLAGVVLHFLDPTGLRLVLSHPLGEEVVFYFGFANVLLAAFNLIPIPPLDGSAVIERLLPSAWWPAYLNLRRFSIVIVLAVVLLFPALFDRDLLNPALNLWLRAIGWGKVAG
jgi:Zn-dependent protease